MVVCQNPLNIVNFTKSHLFTANSKIAVAIITTFADCDKPNEHLAVTSVDWPDMSSDLASSVNCWFTISIERAAVEGFKEY